MPFSEKEKKALAAMKKTYGPEKGERVFYASVNAGKFGKAAKERHGARKVQR